MSQQPKDIAKQKKTDQVESTRKQEQGPPQSPQSTQNANEETHPEPGTFLGSDRLI